MSNIIDTIQVSGVNYTLSATSSGGGNSVVELTQAEYDDLVSGGTVDPTTIYIITDAEEINANDYVTKTSNVVSGYTTYTMLSNVNSGFYSDLTTNEILLRNVSTNKPSNLSFSFYIKGGNGNKTVSLTFNFQAKTASTSSDVTTVWSDELDGFIITITSTSYPYFYGVSSLRYQDDCRIYYKTGTITDKQSAAYLNGIKKGVSGDYVVGFTNGTSISSDGSITVQLLKENSSYVQKNFKVADTDDFSWGQKGVSYKLVEGEYFYSTASLGSDNYCQLPSNAADNYQNGYLGVKLLINPNYNTQNTNRQITISLGGVTNKTDTYWGSYQSLYIYYNGSTDTVNFNNIVGTYGVSSATYDQTSHYITIVIDSESTYSSKYWAIRQIGQGNCWIGVNYQITEVQWYTNKYKPFEYLDKYKQDTLVSGTNIKTINNESILGSGNIDIQGGGGKAIEAGRGISITTGETADTVSFDLPISATTNDNLIIGDNSNVVNDLNNSGKSIVFGRYSKVKAYDSLVGGYNCSNEKGQSQVFGIYSKTKNLYEFGCGRYNNSVSGSSTYGDSGNTLFSVGNGTAENARHNAFEIRQNGDIYLTLNGQDVKLQDHLGGGGGSSYTAGDGIDITNDVISVTGKVDTSTYNTYTAATDTALASKADTSAVTAIQDSLSGYVTTNTKQDITGNKTFIGSSSTSEKPIIFKQANDNHKIGFVCRNTASTNNELATFEFRPDTYTDSSSVKHPLLYLGHYRNTNTANAGVVQTMVGFRQYDQRGAAAYHYLMPLPAEAKTPFSLTTSFKNYFAPLGFKNGGTMITTDNTGVADFSSLLGGLKLVKITAADYAQITPDDNTVYFVGDSTNGYTMKLGSANVN